MTTKSERSRTKEPEHRQEAPSQEEGDVTSVENGPPVDPRKLPDDGLGQGPETRDMQVPQAGPEDDGWQV